ncbi:MAG TPA: cell division protein FtsA [Nitrospirae bacterium]|nr:cell division protein FtsA [Nitrospirota bacterium]
MLKKRQPDNLIIGLDIGSTKTCAISAVINEKVPEVIAYSTKQTRGIRKGILIDLESLSKTIISTIEEIEEKIDIPISNVFLSVPASHVNFINSSSKVNVRKKEVTEDDISKAIESASSVQIDNFFEKIHVIPYEFVLDNTSGILKPLGMSGTILEAKVNILSFDSKILKNLIKCCHNANIEVDSIIIQSLASSEAVLFKDEIENGLLFIEMGGGKTEICAFIDGFIRMIHLLPIGGNHFTQDLAIGLKIPFNEAERIKKTYHSNDNPINIEVLSKDGNIKNIEFEDIDNILIPRAEETFSLIKDIISSWRLNERLLSTVLSGGSSQLYGLIPIAEKILELPVRKGVVNLSNNGNSLNKAIANFDIQELQKPEYASAIGAVNYGAEMYFAEKNRTFRQKTSRFFRSIKKVFSTKKRE